MSLKLPELLNSLVCAVKCFPDNGSRVISPRESLIKATAKHIPTVRCPWDNRGFGYWWPGQWNAQVFVSRTPLICT